MKKTVRGFEYHEFKDSNDSMYTIQKSSWAEDDAIWFGIDKPKLTIFEDGNKGKYVNSKLPENWMVSSRMHLSRKQVAELLPILQKFVDTGEIY